MLTMIIVSVVAAPPGACFQQTTPPETADAYFDSANSASPPKAATQSLTLKPLPIKPQDPVSQAPNLETSAGAATKNPSAASLPLTPRAESPTAKVAAGDSTKSPLPTPPSTSPRTAATRVIDQLAAQATVATSPAPPNTDAQNEPEGQPSATVERDTFEPARVLAIVGGRPILVGDMLYEINERIEQVIPTAPDSVKNQQRRRLYEAWLAKFVDQQLLYTDVVRDLPAEADLDKMFESIGKSFDDDALPDFLKKQKFTKPIDFDIYLRSLGSSLRKFRQRWIEDQFVKYFVSQKFANDYEPTHAEMWAYYQDHLADYTFPARARWEQLVIRFDQVPDKVDARRQIAELGNKVVYGASLAAVAKESSHDSKASEGGQQGWVNKGSLAHPILDSTIFSIPIGELSDILESPVGFHIVRVQERTEAGAQPFRDAQPKIKEALVQQHRAKKLEDYLTKLRQEIPIEIVDPTIQLPEGYTVR